MSDGRVPKALAVDPLYPGNGFPPRPGEDRPGLSPFGRLAMGQCLGKSSILIYNNDVVGVQTAGVDMINVEGDDLDAQQLVVTLHPPRVIPLSFEAVTCGPVNQQNLTGEQNNQEVTSGNFPGTKHPIRWPPLEAFVEYGTGGVSTKVAVDYLNGATLCVPASFLRVTAAVTQSKEFGDISGTSAAYYLAAHVGPGYATSHARRTVFAGNVDNREESAVFDVPKLAKNALLVGHRRHDRHHDHHHRRPPTLTVGWIRFWQDPDGHEGVGDFFVTTPVVVPNTALYFSVYNESGHRMKLSTVFELGL